MYTKSKIQIKLSPFDNVKMELLQYKQTEKKYDLKIFRLLHLVVKNYCTKFEACTIGTFELSCHNESVYGKNWGTGKRTDNVIIIGFPTFYKIRKLYNRNF